MAYGFQVLGPSGLVNLATVRCARVLLDQTCSTASGTATIPSWANASNTIVGMTILDTKTMLPSYSFSGTTFTWTVKNTTYGTASFKLLVYAFK
jgi:hypothetical protein